MYNNRLLKDWQILCRWYSFECAKAITSWGRQYIKSSIEKAEEFGFYAIYADTDGFYAKYKKEKD